MGHLRNPFRDSEERQTRALDAMTALEELLSGQTEGTVFETGPLAALIGLVFDANRDAMPVSDRMGGGANDLDD